MRVRVSILVVSLLAVLLLAGCSTADVGSLEKFLVDLGVPPEAAAQLAAQLQTLATEQAGAVGQQIQTEVETQLGQLIEALRNFRLELPTWVRVAVIVIGIVLLLVGGRLYKVAVAAPGFALGLAIGISVLDLAAELPDAWVVAIAIGIGLIGAALALSVHDLAVLLIGAVVAGLLAISLLATYNVAVGTPFIAIVITCAIAGAIGLLLIARKATWLLSALLGATLVSIGLVENLSLVVIVPAAVIGLAVQGLVRLVRRRKPEEPKPQAAAPQPYPQPQAYPPPVQAAPPPAQPYQPYSAAPPPQRPVSQPPPREAFPPLTPPVRPAEPPAYDAPTPGRAQRPVEWTPQPPYDQPTPPDQEAPPPRWTPQPPADQPTPPESREPLDAAPAGAVDAPPASGATLTAWGAAGPGKRTPILASPFLIGGGPGSHLTLPGLAPVHATILASPAGYYLESQVSPQETRVNGRPARATYLAHGDVLQLGEYELRFEWPPPGAM
ncbi:MAG: hypothetical protein Kow00120_27260 [Anaerolineae bacterium]